MYKSENRSGEAQAARRLIRLIREDKSVSIDVFDSEEWHKGLTTEAAVWDAIGNTDEDVIVARDAAGVQLGRFYLVWGNDPMGEELISDYSDNEYCNKIAEKFSAHYNG